MKKLGMQIAAGLLALGLIGAMAALVFAVDTGMRAVGLIGGH
jgi:hypothetical protein